MLRPATPLAIGFLVAFALLLLSTISTPIVKSIPLGSYQGYNFGVFGYCNAAKTPQQCSPIKLSYNTNIGNSQAFTLPQGTRHSLTAILVVHPIAALFTLICAILAIASHFRGPAHSSRYLLFLLIFSFPTLLVTLLAFLVDILLFVPFMKWGGWIVLAATIIICACSVLTCAMRRTLVSRKARKKRVAENAEMNGENYYASRSQPTLIKEPGAIRESQYARAESPPPLDGDPSTAGTKLPTLTAYETNRSRTSTDDRVPLNPARDPSIRTTSSGGPRVDPRRPPPLTVPNGASRGYGDDGQRSPVSPIEDDYAYSNGQYGQPNRGRNGPYGPGPSQRGGPGTYGPARGGYPPRGAPRGGYAPRGNMPLRGGYGRGGPGGTRGGPQPGWSGNGNGRGGMGPMAGAMAGSMAAGAMMGRGQRGPPPGYGSDYSGSPAPYGRTGMPPDRNFYDASDGQYGGPPSRYQPPDPPVGRGFAERSQSPYGAPGGQYAPPRAPINRPFVNDRPESPYSGPNSRYQSPQPPLNRSYSDERSYTPYGEPPPNMFARQQYSGPPPDASRDRSYSTGQTRDPSSYGFSGRQPSPARSLTRPRDVSPPPPMPPMLQSNAPIGQAIEMDASSGSPAMSPRLGHAPSDSRNLPILSGPYDHHGPPAEIGDLNSSEIPQRHEMAGDGPVELPAHDMVPVTQAKPRHRPRASSDTYYEDVDPRFAQNEPIIVPARQEPASQVMPSSLLPGYLNPGAIDEHNSGSFYSSDPPADVSRTRSPAHSDTSNFTSISQREINPNWGPAPTPYGSDARYRGGPSDGPQKWQPDLSSNPDFIVPGAEAGRRGVGGGRPVGGTHVRGDSQSGGMTGGSRYPGPDAL